jgi:hypothetical protein
MVENFPEIVWLKYGGILQELCVKKLLVCTKYEQCYSIDSNFEDCLYMVFISFLEVWLGLFLQESLP